MKRLLALTLLLLGISALASCNSYDVEGKPEIASNPAKMVFSYYPWEEQTAEPADTGDTAPAGDTGDTDSTPAGDTGDTDTDTGDTDTDTGDTDTDTDTDTDNPGVVVVRSASVADVITEEFEIYNRGVTGELKIRKIFMLDPNGQIIADLDNATYKKLFEIEVQAVDENGIAVKDSNGNPVYGAKGLSFDNMKGDSKKSVIRPRDGEEEGDGAEAPAEAPTEDGDADAAPAPAASGAQMASLCPLDLKDNTKCKNGFDDSKYNSRFKIRLSYSKDAAEALKNKPLAEKLDDGETLKYKQFGDFSIEICTNDPTKSKTDTCGPSSTSYRIQITRQQNKPPKPIIHVTFDYPAAPPMSYRNIYDKVQMDLKETCVSDPNNPSECLANWQEKYFIKYKWEMKESPTPYLVTEDGKSSVLQLTETDDASAGQWISDNGGDNPKRAHFTGLMITPRRLSDSNPTYNEAKCSSECGEEPANINDKYYFMDLSEHLLCRQKYCEKYRTKHYKINIQAETVDKETDLVSDTTDITVIPKIIPQARVVAQLTWKEGYKTKAEADVATKEGASIDLDIHMIKKSSLEAPTYGFSRTDGLLGTAQRTDEYEASCPVTLEECEKYWRHDDCSFGDQGLESAKIANGQTIGWHASLDIDNTWGGNNYETPETIGLGPIEDKVINATGQAPAEGETSDGIPDVDVIDDQYLIVVGYVACNSKYSDGLDHCSKEYTGENSVYTVNAKVDILVDGIDVPREAGNGRPADNYSDSSKDFQISYNEWKIIAAVKWDNSLPSPETNPKYPGNAIVSDTALTSAGITTDAKSYPKCFFDNSDAILIPIWDKNDYRNAITQLSDPEDPASYIGTCEGGSSTGGDTGDTGSDTGDTGSDTGDTDTDGN